MLSILPWFQTDAFWLKCISNISRHHSVVYDHKEELTNATVSNCAKTFRQLVPSQICMLMYVGCVENGLFNLSLKFNLMKIHCFKYVSCWESCIVRYRSYANDKRQQRRKVCRMLYMSTGLLTYVDFRKNVHYLKTFFYIGDLSRLRSDTKN